MRTLRLTVLLLLCLLATVHGIRLEREVSASLKQQIHEEKSLSGGTVVGAVVLCKGGHCSSGHARKLITMDVKETGHEINDDERHPNITDLVEMDYHPVKRKSPVHN
ncbi:hypothetical protein QJS04_geneDACA003755 [Acorus gramineus]|uniref:Uncharacterized protein n=1 Tax=Acorus gramineus TaxID=55184 RepID=A0AAV9BHT1_ACOGR|nr:hypothetical protein QJS04_geneDACA003755 [Acorus gramineus]